MATIKEQFAVPDFMKVESKECIHVWKCWRSMTYRIDNYVHRFYTATHPNNGTTKIFDCKAPIGMIMKQSKMWGASAEETEEMRKWGLEMQLLKNQKARYNAIWSKIVFGRARGGAQSALEHKASEILDMFGKFYTIDEVKKIALEKWQFHVLPMDLHEFYTKYEPKIRQMRAEYVLTGKEIRLATDAGRMEVLSKIAWEMEKKFDKTQSIEYSKELRATIEQIRKEIKGEEIRLTLDGKIDINATIQANQTIHEALQKLPINMIVIGLTAAKKQINPAHLIASLANSYYSKFNGFGELFDKSEIALPGQYIKAYNWEELKRLNEAQIEDAESIEVVEKAIPEPEKVVVLNKQQQMIEMLRKLKGE